MAQSCLGSDKMFPQIPILIDSSLSLLRNALMSQLRLHTWVQK